MKINLSNSTFLLVACLVMSFVSCSSSSSKAEGSKEEKEPLRIMSYNIRACRGGEKLENPTKENIYTMITKVIDEAKPEVIAVQEVDSVTKRNNGQYILGEIAKRTSMHPVFGPSIDFQGGKYGIGVLSKEEPISHKRIALPGKEEPRSLLIVEFENYVFCCTHLSLTAEDCLASVNIIENELKSYKKPVFLAGDMNSVYESEPQQALRKSFTVFNDHTQNTIPSEKPTSCIDFIYGLNNGHTFDVLYKEVLKTEASDHLPVVVDVQVD